MSPTERRKGGQSSHDGQNFFPELESVEWSERGVSVAKQIDLSKWDSFVPSSEGESCPLMMGLVLSRNCARSGQSGFRYIYRTRRKISTIVRHGRSVRDG